MGNPIESNSVVMFSFFANLYVSRASGIGADRGEVGWWSSHLRGEVEWELKMDEPLSGGAGGCRAEGCAEFRGNVGRRGRSSWDETTLGVSRYKGRLSQLYLVRKRQEIPRNWIEIAEKEKKK